MTNIIDGFEMMKSMREMRKSMQDLLAVSKQANVTFTHKGDTSLTDGVNRLAETVSVIEDTEKMLQGFYRGEVTLEELEAFRDEIAAMRK